MKLWFRLIGYFISIFFMKKLDNVLSLSNLNFRVWPTDLDLSMHMNNGRYLTIMDFGRLDIMARTPLLKVSMRLGLTPVITKAVIRFRRELKLFEPFMLQSHICYWDDETVVFEQKIIFKKGPRKGSVAAYALIRAGLYDRKKRRFITVEELMAETGFYPDEKPELTDEMKKFLEMEETLKQSARTKRGRD